jgi:hypothetical protein
MPCGYGFGRATAFKGLSASASPTITLLEPMQLTNQVLLSAENTMSSPTVQPFSAMVLIAYGFIFMSITRSSDLPSAVM